MHILAAQASSEKARQRQESVNGALRTCNDELKQEVLKLNGAQDVKAFKNMEAELSALKEENRSISDQLHKATLKEEKLQRENNELQAEINKVKEARAHADGIIDSLQSRNSTLTAENADLKGKVREAEQADRRAKKEQTKHDKTHKALGPQLEAAQAECRQLSAELDEAKAARLRLTDELAESQRRNSEHQAALRLLERDGRRAQQELEKHRKTIGRITEECKGKQQCIESMSSRINEILDALRESTRSAADNTGAMQELMRERQRAELLERQLQSALNEGTQKEEVIEELTNQPACLICDDKQSEQTFMLRDANGPPGIDVCGHLYCKSCLDQGDFRVCPFCKLPIVKRVSG
ncbi:hypothetical protein AAVH_28529 [Aphelenchoides avenae]|nr:hypothetical protein AAVH_28529 [Aphelenchus avenae]